MELLTGALATAATLACGWGCWRLGVRIGERLGKRAGEGAAAAALLATLVLVGLVRRNSADLPLAVVLSPLVYIEFAYFVPTLALFFGVAAQRVPRPQTKRALAALAGAVSLYGAAHVFLAIDAWSLPQLDGTPRPGPVQAQTTGWSCGAASAVTLLRGHGIESTEREMGELCLTMPYRGTTTPRFLRGLTLKLRRVGSLLRVRAEDGLSVDDLDRFPRPCILGIRGSLLVGHAVVFLERSSPGSFRIADPLPLGRGSVRELRRSELEAMFTGEAVGLEPAGPSAR